MIQRRINEKLVTNQKIQWNRLGEVSNLVDNTTMDKQFNSKIEQTSISNNIANFFGKISMYIMWFEVIHKVYLK
jgi:hypothetical protein